MVYFWEIILQRLVGMVQQNVYAGTKINFLLRLFLLRPRRFYMRVLQSLNQ